MLPMKKRSINSNREKQPIYDQNVEDIHRTKKGILHPPFSEIQPEKVENKTFLYDLLRYFLTKKTDL